MQITLKIGGKDSTFSMGFIPGIVFRNAMEITQKIDFKNLKVEDVDALVDFAVDAFNKQFTRDEFYYGVDARGMITLLIDVVDAIVERATDAIGVHESDPNSQRRA